MKHAQAIVSPGSWKLSKNEIWNIPEKDVHFKIEQLSNNFEVMNSLVGKIVSLTALVIDTKGKIYGVRKATEIKEDGYCCRGQMVRK